MKTRRAPRIATWILDHLAPQTTGGAALSGDLREEFLHGRSWGWYWRQTITAVLVGYAAVLDRLRIALVFAVLWSAAAPFAMLAWYRIEFVRNWFECIIQLPWPWSALAQLTIPFSIMILLIWAGFVLYMLLQTFVKHSRQWHRVVRAMALAPIVWLPATGIAILIADLLPDVSLDIHRMTMIGILTDSRSILLVDIPVMLSLFVALAAAHPVHLHTQADRPNR